MRLSGWAFLAAALAACGSDGADDDDPPAYSPGDRGTFEKILDGTLTAKEGLKAVAWSGGWPIATEDGFLFAIEDGEPAPERLLSPSGAFEPVDLERGHGACWALVKIAAPEGATYQFTTKFNDALADPWSRRYAYLQSQEISVVSATAPHLERWQQVGDANLPERTLRVWVPAEKPTHFLYAHDGENLFNPFGPYGGWHLDEAAGPTTLVIGIDNTSARIDEYTHVADEIPQAIGGQGTAYADYVEHTVRPFIESRYGTPARVGLVGSSLGGLISYYEELLYPGSYDFVASLSGTFGWGSIGVAEQTLIEAYAELATCPDATFYLDSGGNEGSGCVDSDGDGTDDDTPDSGDNFCENVQMKETLEALGCGDRFTYVWIPGAQHNEAAWRGRSPQILEIFEAL